MVGPLLINEDTFSHIRAVHLLAGLLWMSAATGVFSVAGLDWIQKAGSRIVNPAGYSSSFDSWMEKLPSNNQNLCVVLWGEESSRCSS